MKTLISVVCVLACLSGCERSISERAESDEVTFVDEGDAAMERAFEKARSTLDDFLVLAESPRDGTEGYALKVALTDGEQTEYFWVNQFEADGESFSGVLNNEPQLVKTHQLGDRIEFQRNQVVDWTYLEPAARRMHGNFTACALLVHEDPQEAEAFKKQYGLQCD